MRRTVWTRMLDLSNAIEDAISWSRLLFNTWWRVRSVICSHIQDRWYTGQYWVERA